MRYWLDTDHISIIQRRSGDAYQRLRDRMSQYPAADFALCVVNFHEQSFNKLEPLQKSPQATNSSAKSSKAWPLRPF
jgi:hypothetical protein